MECLHCESLQGGRAGKPRVNLRKRRMGEKKEEKGMESKREEEAYLL